MFYEPQKYVHPIWKKEEKRGNIKKEKASQDSSDMIRDSYLSQSDLILYQFTNLHITVSTSGLKIETQFPIFTMWIIAQTATR